MVTATVAAVMAVVAVVSVMAVMATAIGQRAWQPGSPLVQSPPQHVLCWLFRDVYSKTFTLQTLVSEGAKA